MQYSPKLKKAAEEIKAVLKKYDIGATIVLHTPGFSEFINRFDPGYSCVRLENNNYLRFRAKLADYNGDKAVHHRKIEDSYNMLQHFHDISQRNMLAFGHLLEQLKKHVEVIGGDDQTNITGHDQQNN